MELENYGNFILSLPNLVLLAQDDTQTFRNKLLNSHIIYLISVTMDKQKISRQDTSRGERQ